MDEKKVNYIEKMYERNPFVRKRMTGKTMQDGFVSRIDELWSFNESIEDEECGKSKEDFHYINKRGIGIDGLRHSQY